MDFFQNYVLPPVIGVTCFVVIAASVVYVQKNVASVQIVPGITLTQKH